MTEQRIGGTEAFNCQRCGNVYYAPAGSSVGVCSFCVGAALMTRPPDPEPRTAAPLTDAEIETLKAWARGEREHRAYLPSVVVALAELQTLRDLESRGQDAVATILYRTPAGEEGEWRVGAVHGADTPESLAAHLARWMPSCEFLGVKVEMVERGALTLSAEEAVVMLTLTRAEANLADYALHDYLNDPEPELGSNDLDLIRAVGARLRVALEGKVRTEGANESA